MPAFQVVPGYSRVPALGSISAAVLAAAVPNLLTSVPRGAQLLMSAETVDGGTSCEL
jgi:hypothetical protein